MLSDPRQVFEHPPGALVSIRDATNEGIVSGWDTNPAVHGFHSRIDVMTSQAVYCLVLAASGNYRQILLGSELLWFNVGCLSPLLK